MAYSKKTGALVLVHAPSGNVVPVKGLLPAGAVHVFAVDLAVTYCTAGTSASGCQATLTSSGNPSASLPGGFSLAAATVEGEKDGLFYFGTSGQQANPWGNGTSYQCVVPPVRRAGLLIGNGTVGLCDGTFAQDLNALWCQLSQAGREPWRRRDGPGPALVPRPRQHEQPDDEPLQRDQVSRRSVTQGPPP